MERLAPLHRNARPIELLGLGLTALIFLAWGASAALHAHWSHPFVWTPAFFLLARALQFTVDARTLNRPRFLIYTLMLLAGAVATIGGLIRNDEWLFNLGLGAGVWLGIGEWFWRASDPRCVAPKPAGSPCAEPAP